MSTRSASGRARRGARFAPPMVALLWAALCLLAAGCTPGATTFTAVATGAQQTPPVDTAYLPDADLSGADLTDAYLYFATLSRVNLNGANLTRAVSLAFLDGADLRNATLLDAFAGGADLRNVTWGNTTCPVVTNSDADDGDGFTCESNMTPG